MDFFEKHWMILVAGLIGVVFYSLWTINKRSELNMKKWEAVLYSTLLIFFGIFSLFFFAWIEVGFDFARAANLRIFGTLFFLIIYIPIVIAIKKAGRDALDIFFLPAVLVLALGRLMCIFQGCCYGSLIPGTSFRWPIREAEIIAGIVFFIITYPLVKKKKTNGYAMPLYVTLMGLLRFCLEFMRDHYLPPEGKWHLAHTWSLVLLFIGLLWLLILRFNLVAKMKPFFTKKTQL